MITPPQKKKKKKANFIKHVQNPSKNSVKTKGSTQKHTWIIKMKDTQLRFSCVHAKFEVLRRKNFREIKKKKVPCKSWDKSRRRNKGGYLGLSVLVNASARKATKARN